MSLNNIRAKNKNQNSFINTKIEDVKMSFQESELIKNKVFRKVIRPINYRSLEQLNNT
ncbi:spermidine acetyltransferase [uncultured Clostridium sp.]|uniref:spermidine acetyltransferase n=1 Tax=uncultured Clostridium sp. TaxID=59620 RepID=UPI00321746B1